VADTLTVGGALDRVPLGTAHRRILAVTGAAWAFAAMEVLLVSFTLAPMRDLWGLSGAAAGLLGSASLVGMVAGSWLGGTLADDHGRLRTLQVMVAGYALAAGLTAAVDGYLAALALRALTGVGIGGTATAATVYLSEHLPTANRGSYLTYLDAFWAVGTIAAVVAAWLLLGPPGDALTPAGVDDWRLLFALGAIPLVLLPALRSFEETPHYLARRGDLDAARARIESLARANGSPLDLSGTSLTVVDADDTTGGLRRLLAPALRRRTVVVIVAWFGANLGFYGVFIWLPDTVDAASLVGGSYRYLLLAAVVQIPGYLSAAALVDRIGARRTLGIYLVGAGVATYVFAAALPGITPGFVTGLWPFLLGLTAASFFSVGAFGSLRAYTPALFPTDVRSTGGGLAEGTGRIAGIVGPIIAGGLVESGYLVALAPLAVGFALAGAVVLLQGVETHGAALE
jgi:putative MFS transporter